jgi:cytochrome P450
MATAVDYNPFSAAVKDDPYSLYEDLRREHHLYWNDRLQFWALTRFADVQAAARDWERFSNRGGIDLDYTGPIQIGSNLIEMDPPHHEVIRDVVRECFTPRSLAERGSRVRAKAEKLVNTILERGSGDLARELCWPLPLAVATDLVGLPKDDADRLGGLLRQAFMREPDSAEIPTAAIRAGEELRSYFTEACVRSHDRNRERDPMGLLVDAAVDGRLGVDEAVSNSMALFIAAVETTSGLLSNALLALARHPDERRLLLNEPAQIQQAIEEVMRYDAPLQTVMRTLTCDTELFGRCLPRGSRVLLVLGSANRDERRWADADRFGITREQKRQIGFGEGIHHCLGAPLARLEGRIVLEVVLHSIPEYEIDGPIERLSKPDIRALTSLPVAW